VRSLAGLFVLGGLMKRLTNTVAFVLTSAEIAELQRWARKQKCRNPPPLRAVVMR